MKVVLIFLCVCYFELVFASIFVDDPSAVEACVSNFCEHFFGKNNTVYVVVEDNYTSFKINIPNPVVLVNVNQPYQIVRNGYKGHYVIYTEDALSLNQTMGQLRKLYAIPQFSIMPHSIERNSLIITKSKNITNIFTVLWDQHIFNAVVLQYDDLLDAQNVTVYQSHPFFDHENECRKFVKVLHPHKCNNITTVRKYSKTITTYPKLFSPVWLSDIRSGYSHQMFHTYLNFIEQGLNVTMLFTKSNLVKNITLRSHYYVEDYGGDELGFSESIHNEDVIFIVPTPPTLSPLQTIFILFHTEVWVMVAFGLILVWLSWSLLAKYLKLNYNFERYTRICMHVLSIAVWGSTNSFPMHRALRCLVVCFIFYSVIMQTAFTSNLLHFMITPQYESDNINSLKDLVESKLDIFGVRTNFHVHFHHNLSNDSFPYKLQQQMLDLPNRNRRFKLFEDIVTYKNCAVLTSRDDISYMQRRLDRYFQKGKDYKIIEDAYYIKPNVMLFYVYPLFFFRMSIDVIIRRIKESGINHKILNDLHEKFFQRRNWDDDDMKEPLSLEHLAWAFSVLGIGLLIAFLVFLAEIWYWKGGKNSKITPTFQRKEPEISHQSPPSLSTATLEAEDENTTIEHPNSKRKRPSLLFDLITQN